LNKDTRKKVENVVNTANIKQ